MKNDNDEEDEEKSKRRWILINTIVQKGEWYE